MTYPSIELYKKENWIGLAPDVKQQILSNVLQYLVVIDEKEHPLQNDNRQGAIAAEKRSLENFVQQVILWERTIQVTSQAHK